MRRRKGIATRARRHAGTFWEDRRREVLGRDRACVRCGRGARGDVLLDVAHIIGLGTRGSRHDASLDLNGLTNLVVLCRVCHRQKDEGHSWPWASIGVVPDPILVARYGYREPVQTLPFGDGCEFHDKPADRCVECEWLGASKGMRLAWLPDGRP